MTDTQFLVLFEGITAIATLAVPVVVAVMANRFNHQVKHWEASQWRNQELIKARLEYYRDLVPRLNDLMCYFTFIGPWKDFTPPAIVQLKRELDHALYCAAPLFSEAVLESYNTFMNDCFETYGPWGTDARLRTDSGRRREAAGQSWDDSWGALFADGETQPVSAEALGGIRSSYNALIAAFASDIDLNEPRRRYVNARTDHVELIPLRSSVAAEQL